MREHVTSLESQLRSHERNIQSIQPKFMDALRDRGTFEKECQKALAKASAAAERLEAQKAEVEALKEKNKALESKLAETNDTLATSTIPEIAKLAQAEKDRAEALATVEKLEKKIRGVQNEVDYSRKAYQDASNAYTELNQETQELRTQVTELGRRASDNLLKLHQIHAQNELTEVNKQIDELQALLENRERELDRAKEDLKYFKSGRRETRQASVPRSPRTGVISPRPARGMGGGTGSRGTSPAPLSSDGPGIGGGGAPVPGMTFLPTAGNGGRWGHLRD
jgi:chromosome segregation ATPase